MCSGFSKMRVYRVQDCYFLNKDSNSEKKNKLVRINAINYIIECV